ncbi:MAG: PSD1 and planctomycete cytochrome C domain-containing protein [Pirellulales bacterium]
MRFPVILLLALLLAALALPQRLGAAEVRFDRDVRPILAGKCWTCHGPDDASRQADLRLDARSEALADHGSGAAIVPGKAAESGLMLRVMSADDGERMPPPDHGPALASAEIEILRQWIDQGASYEQHWAFQPIVRPAPPPVESGETAHNPIDHFVLAALRKQGLAASPEADRRTLLRRVSLDLTGLPPTAEEADGFASDSRPEAYAEAVERLLASPHYGERWGRHWLDQARYADSNGYTIDGEREMWPYRDWVIRALNADLPFDQFTIEQLAGDLLPEPTKDQRIATGFHRNTLINQEGGVDPEQFRIEAVVDRVATTGAVWLGLTVGCAQCHTHKYDPITHREYYQLFAFFNDTADVNNTGPTVEVHEGEQFLPPDAVAERGELNEAAARVERLVAERPQRRTAWEQEIAGRSSGSSAASQTAWQTLSVSAAKAEKSTLTVLDDQSVLATPGILREIYVIDTVALPAGAKVGSFRLRFIPHESLPKTGPGLATNGNLVLSAVEAFLGDERLPLVSASADHAQKSYPVAALIDDDPGTGWAINVEPGSTVKMNAEHTVLLTLARPIACDGRPLRFVLKHELNNDFNVGRVQFAVAEEVVDTLADPVFLAALAVPAADRTTEQQQLIDSKFDALDQPLKEVRSQLDEVRRRLGLGPAVKAMVMQQVTTPRDTFVLRRGDFLQPDKELGPLAAGVPAALPALPPRGDGRPSRLDFARWLVSREHPLTARVTVNRVWLHYFGRGLVETENDFGSRGSAPSHPELLDWLAGEFMDRGWSLKALHRLIVTSATYRQSSHAREDAANVDPLNLLLARQNRLRLDAEIVRDAALHAAGKLSPKIGGPSVHPPQPDGVYAFTQNKKVWQTAQGEARYRRGLYTMFYRSAPYPTLSVFDTPDFQSVCTRRQRSNTPLQALTMANDQALVELAQELAAGALARWPSDSPEEAERRIVWIFGQALSRPPSAAELELLRDHLQQSPAAADAREVWTGVARAVMNTDEFITRE